VRLGIGVEGYWLGRKNWRVNVVLYYYQLLCRLRCMTSGFGNFMHLQNTMFLVLIIIWLQRINLTQWTHYNYLTQGGSFKVQHLCLVSISQPTSNNWQLNQEKGSSTKHDVLLGWFWYEIYNWLCLVSVKPAYTKDHIIQFCSLGGFSEHTCNAFLFDIVFLCLDCLTWQKC